MRIKPFSSVVGLLLLMATAASADVIVQKQTTIDNLFGLGGSTTTETEYVKADRSYSESETKFDSKLMKLATGGKNTKEGTIVRLDKGLMQRLNFDKKIYTETDLNTFKNMVDNASDMTSQTPENSTNEMGQEEQMPDEDEYDWTFNVTKDDKDVKVNGFACKHVTATATGVNKTDSSKKVLITTEQWLTENDPSFDELKAYEQNYAGQTGMNADEMEQAWGKELQGFGKQMSGLGDEMKDIKGYPIKTIITMEVTVPDDEAGKDENATADQSDDQNAAAKEAMKKLGGLFGKKKDKSKKEVSSEKAGYTKMFSATTQILSVKKSNISDSQFDIPSGFTKANY